MEQVKICTSDGVDLSAILWSPEAANKERIVIIASATGVRKEFYSAFAQFLTTVGYHVVAFDYRGIGDSRGSKHEDNKFRMYHWGEFDISSVIAWAGSKFGQLNLVAHSIGGQVFPFAFNHDVIKNAVFISCQNVSWQHWSGFEKVKVLFFWYAILPLVIKIFGNLPSWVLGGGEDIPKEIARDWRRFGIHRNGILLDDNSRKEAYKAVTTKIQFVSIDDDHALSPTKSVTELVKNYNMPETNHLRVNPHIYGFKSIGHFGFFRKKIGSNGLWQDVIKHLEH